MHESIQSVLERGQSFEEAEEYEKALFLYEEAMKSYPENIDVVFRAAHISELLGNKEKAVDMWKKVLTLNPADAGAYSKLVDLYYETDKYLYYLTRAKLKITENSLTQAISDLKKAVENAPDEKTSLEAMFILGQMYMQTGKNQQAIDEFVRMLHIEDNINVYFILSQLYEAEDIDMAIETLKQAVEKFPDSKNLKERLAFLYTKQNNPETALEHAQSPNLKAKAYLQKGENEKAFEEINKIQNKDYNYYSLLAEYYFNTEKFDDCLRTISSLEKMNALNPAPYQMKALVYEEKNDNFNSYYNWGKCYELQGKYEMALSEYLNAYNEDEKNTSVIEQIVNLYEILGEKYPALEFVQKYVAIEPNNVNMNKKLADYFMNEGNIEEAIDCLEKCVENGCSDYGVIVKLAKFYDKSKKYKKALEYYEQYIQNAPISQEMEIVKARIDELRKIDLSNEEEISQDEEGFFDKIINLFKKK